jgi:hypothetical protein
MLSRSSSGRSRKDSTVSFAHVGGEISRDEQRTSRVPFARFLWNMFVAIPGSLSFGLFLYAATAITPNSQQCCLLKKYCYYSIECHRQAEENLEFNSFISPISLNIFVFLNTERQQKPGENGIEKGNRCNPAGEKDVIVSTAFWRLVAIHRHQ